MATKVEVEVVRGNNSWKTVVKEKPEIVLLKTKNGYVCYKQPTMRGEK